MESAWHITCSVLYFCRNQCLVLYFYRTKKIHTEVPTRMVDDAASSPRHATSASRPLCPVRPLDSHEDLRTVVGPDASPPIASSTSSLAPCLPKLQRVILNADVSSLSPSLSAAAVASSLSPSLRASSSSPPLSLSRQGHAFPSLVLHAAPTTVAGLERCGLRRH
jgi:hypothetical protein